MRLHPSAAASPHTFPSSTSCSRRGSGPRPRSHDRCPRAIGPRAIDRRRRLRRRTQRAPAGAEEGLRELVRACMHARPPHLSFILSLSHSLAFTHRFLSLPLTPCSRRVGRRCICRRLCCYSCCWCCSCCCWCYRRWRRPSDGGGARCDCGASPQGAAGAMFVRCFLGSGDSSRRWVGEKEAAVARWELSLLLVPALSPPPLSFSSSSVLLPPLPSSCPAHPLAFGAAHFPPFPEPCEGD
jgi:hypothetical protein